jgi:hypothetical protein
MIANLIGNFFIYILEVVKNTGYWIASIICVCSMILYAVTNAGRFMQISLGTIVIYVLLLGIGSAI